MRVFCIYTCRWIFWERQPAVQEQYKRHKVSFVIICNWQDHIVHSQQAFVLTSALHLPYFRMPLSRKKYLCREKGGRWANEKRPGWYATSLTASLKSVITLLWLCDHDRVRLLLMYVVNVSAVRCLSSQALVLHLVCLYHSSSHSAAIFLPHSLHKCDSWCSYCTSPEPDCWKHKDLKSSDCKSILNVYSSINQQTIS